MSSDTLNILLIEDNPADADLLQEILDEAKNYIWKITHVDQLSLALNILSQKKFDIILSDLSLPDAQGLGSITQLCNMVPGLPVVVLTGLNDENIGLEALRKGAQDYLVKGQIQTNLLVRTIRYAIERSQTQQTLRQQSAAMDASTEGIAILNAKREHVYVNHAFAKLQGYERLEDLIGKTLDTLYQQSKHHFLWDLIEPTLKEQGYWQGEVEINHFSNEISYQELLITSLADGGYVCNTHDITSRKRAEVEILQALERERELNELKSKFVAIVSHEFRTPLTTILSSVELLQKYGHQVSVEKNQLRFHRIIHGVYRMTQLLNDVLIFNKAEAGKMSFNPKPLNIVEWCHNFVEEMQSQTGDHHPIIFTTQSSKDNTYHLDEQLLRHILSNLISNAIKYSPENTDICIQLKCEAQRVILSISDQGIGIPTPDLERLFSVFYRASNVGTIPGTGLGLAIVKQCVDLHGGTIDIRSKLDQGTEFKITLLTSSGL